MCGLFGFVRYGEEIKNLNVITNSLAKQSAVRGTDATGIAFCDGRKLKVVKDGKSAYEMDFKHSDSIRSLIGHTRHSTHGSEKKNCNNHPFQGRVGDLNFALAHNGVLYNDDELRRCLCLPKTKIETDSYVAAQLLMSRNELGFDALKYMAEKVCGSFSFSIIDGEDNLYLVKGDSPLHILHFPKSKIYVYASTESILYKSLVDTPLFAELKEKAYDEVAISAGDILRIKPNGVMDKSSFVFSDYYGKAWWEIDLSRKSSVTDTYIENLKYMAAFEGIDPEEIDLLLAEGFTYDEIEEYLYGM